jgi:hypothetical protein
MKKWIYLLLAMVLVINLGFIGAGCKAKEETKPPEAPAPAAPAPEATPAPAAPAPEGTPAPAAPPGK